MKFIALAVVFLLAAVSIYAFEHRHAHAQTFPDEGDTGAVMLYTEVVAATPDRMNVAAITMTAQAFMNEASCRNAQEWFKRQVPNSPFYGVTTNSWCTIKVPF